MSDNDQSRRDNSPKVEMLTNIKARYVKSPAFRTVHIDGIWGGQTPGAHYISMTGYSQRWAIPDSETLAGDATVIPGTSAPREIIREVEVCLIFSLEDAISMRAWLDEHINKTILVRQTIQSLNVETKPK